MSTVLTPSRDLIALVPRVREVYRAFGGIWGVVEG